VVVGDNRDVGHSGFGGSLDGFPAGHSNSANGIPNMVVNDSAVCVSACKTSHSRLYREHNGSGVLSL
jgi:hypothetical protein